MSHSAYYSSFAPYISTHFFLAGLIYMSTLLRAVSFTARNLHISNQKQLSLPSYLRTMSTVNLTAPNGKKITLNTGLFIDNKFVKAKSGDTITSIDPA